MNFNIRKAVKADAQIIFDLIYELAVYEKAPDAVTNSVQQIEIDGFGNKPLFECILAESIDNEVVGMALYYTTYSTWKGKMVQLEDLIVKENFRKNGIGKLLLDSFLKETAKINAKVVKWEVLDWNQPAIDFYKQYQVKFDAEWIQCKLYEHQIKTYNNI